MSYQTEGIEVDSANMKGLYSQEIDACRQLAAGPGPALADELENEIERIREQRRRAHTETAPMRAEVKRLRSKADELTVKTERLLSELRELQAVDWLPVRERTNQTYWGNGDPGTLGDRAQVKLDRPRSQALHREADRIEREIANIESRPAVDSGEISATGRDGLLVKMEQLDPFKVGPRYDEVVAWLDKVARGSGPDVALEITLRWEDGKIAKSSSVRVAEAVGTV